MNLGILFAVGIFFTGIATWSDLKTKTISNRIVFLTAIMGVLFSFLVSPGHLITSLIVGGIFLAVGFIISVSGGWGGGDGKFLGALGTYFHPIPIVFLMSLIASTMLFKSYLILTGKDPGQIPREEWMEKGTPFLPAFLLTEAISLFLIMFIL